MMALFPSLNGTSQPEEKPIAHICILPNVGYLGVNEGRNRSCGRPGDLVFAREHSTSLLCLGSSLVLSRVPERST